jgi:mannose-6-phosphate isomerase-like protein (cupin superfamily)
MRFKEQKHSTTKGSFTFGNDTKTRLNKMSLKADQKTPHESIHLHKIRVQLFAVIQGELHLEVDGKIVKLDSSEAYEVPANTPYRLVDHKGDTTFVVAGTHNVYGDKVILKDN